MIEYRISIERYGDDTGKKVDGNGVLCIKTEDGVTFEEVQGKSLELIKSVLGAVNSTLGNKDFIREFQDEFGTAPVFANAFCALNATSERSCASMYNILKDDSWWWHVFRHDELARQRTSMFEKADCELESHFEEPSIEDILGESKREAHQERETNFTRDAYISKTGELLNGVPDYWMTQAGLI